MQKVPRTSPSFEMSGSDQAARNPLIRAKSRASSGHRGSLETSGIITRCFVNAAVPQEPLLGPIGQGEMAALKAAGTPGPAPRNNFFPSVSIKQTIELAGGACASMTAHKSSSTSDRLAPLAIISSVRFSAASRDSTCDGVVVFDACLDADPAGCATLAAALSCISWSDLSRDSGKLFISIGHSCFTGPSCQTVIPDAKTAPHSLIR